MYYILSMSVHNNLYAKRIKVSEVYADNNGDNSSLLMDDGEVVFRTDGYMELNTTDTLNIKGSNQIILDTPNLRTTMTGIVNDDQIITKKHFDDNILPITEKTQHITADATETKIEEKTTMRETTIGYNDISENIYLSSVGDSIGLYKNPLQRGYVGYINQTVTLGGVGTDKIYGDNDADILGLCVDISDDGNIVAVASRNGSNVSQNETGNGYGIIYKLTNGNWVQLGQKLYADDENDALNQFKLSSDGNIVAVGALKNDDNRGNVRIYQYNSTSLLWEQLGQEIIGEAAADESGVSIALSSDGETIIIGANRNDPNGINSAGHARVFRYNGSGWSQVGDDIDGIEEYENTGLSVDISANGERIAVGIPYGDVNGLDNNGYVKLYDLVNNNWVQLGSSINGLVSSNNFGFSLSLSDDGNIIAIGSHTASLKGEVKMFKYNENWEQLGQTIVGDNIGDRLSVGTNALSLSGDGSTFSVGSYTNDDNGTDTGQCRVYRYNNSSLLWEQLGQTILGDNPQDRLGQSVSLNDDGNILIVGVYLGDETYPTNDNKGYFIVYQYAVGQWINMGKFGELIYSNFTDLYSGIINIALDVNLDWTVFGGILSLYFGIYEIRYQHGGGSGGQLSIYANNTLKTSTVIDIPANGSDDIVRIEFIYDVPQKVFTIQSRGITLLTFIDNSTDTPTDEQIKTFKIQAGSVTGLVYGVSIYDIDVKNDNSFTKVEIDSTAINLNGVQPIIFKDTGSQVPKGSIVSADNDKLYVFGTRGIELNPQLGLVNINGGLKIGDWVLSTDIGNGNLTALHSSGTEVVLAQP